MKKNTRICAVSINTTAVAIDMHCEQIIKTAQEVYQKKFPQIIIFPELCITGYGCEDLFFSQAWVNKALNRCLALAKDLPPKALIGVGTPVWHNGRCYNGVVFFYQTQCIGIVCKQSLANDGLHYEARWFSPWKKNVVDTIIINEQPVAIGDLRFDCDGIRIGVEICEDAWQTECRPAVAFAKEGMSLILNPSASHFGAHKWEKRLELVQKGADLIKGAYLYVNLLGCEAGRIIYDGGNILASFQNEIQYGARLSFSASVIDCFDVSLTQFTTTLQRKGVISLPALVETGKKIPHCNINPLTTETSLLMAMALGLWDWQRKTKTAGFCLSLSGGADSSLCLVMVYLAHVLALLSLGQKTYSEHLISCGINIGTFSEQSDTEWFSKLIMPQVLTTVYQRSKFSTDATYQSARQLTKALGVTFSDWSIDDLVDTYTQKVNTFDESYAINWETSDIALQNIQARVRSPGIWFLANLRNQLLISTSNLSEAVVGYCTMDGDTSGVIGPIGGLSKSWVLTLNNFLEKEGFSFGNHHFQFKALHYCNALTPSAELRAGSQQDEMELMPFSVLDAIRVLQQVGHISSNDLLKALQNSKLGHQYTEIELHGFIERYLTLYIRNQWKRERLAPAFFLMEDSACPKTYRRFPIISSEYDKISSAT